MTKGEGVFRMDIKQKEITEKLLDNLQNKYKNLTGEYKKGFVEGATEAFKQLQIAFNSVASD